MASPYSLTWLPGVLKAAGLKVVEQPGWQTRGHGDVGAVKGVLCHHTAGGRNGNAGSLGIVTDGRPDLRGPLSQLVLGRDGTFYVVAAGKSWHAGAGAWQGIKDGNSQMIGIEAENTGLENDHPWPAVQMEAYAKGVAALLIKIGASVIMCAGHLEYATPTGRKSDPSFSIGNRQERIAAMGAFRLKVSEAMAALKGTPQPSPTQPAPEQSQKRGTVIPADLNLRAEASASSAVLQVMQRGMVVVIIGERMNGPDKWLHVNVGGKIGWAAGRHVKLLGA